MEFKLKEYDFWDGVIKRYPIKTCPKCGSEMGVKRSRFYYDYFCSNGECNHVERF